MKWTKDEGREREKSEKRKIVKNDLFSMKVMMINYLLRMALWKLAFFCWLFGILSKKPNAACEKLSMY